jgi:RNA polymerase sigma-70 factor (ECF subfamily)
MNMSTVVESDARGEFDARYLAFLETVATLRPRLHRYCARMTGSVFDGEDVVQEALFEAYRKLDTFAENRPLAPWLFRIAHNRCIDALRRRRVREGAEAGVQISESVEPVHTDSVGTGRALEYLVITLPPKERACVLLKDVFDYSLEEIAELVDSTVGGVKAALNRGRSKLAAIAAAPTPLPATRPSASRLLDLYVDRFNRRDWDGVRELISADARLNVADRFAGRVADSPYFANYARLRAAWRMAVGEIDGTQVLIRFHDGPEGWKPAAVLHLEIADDRIVHIRDYGHCSWVLPG